MLDLLIKSKTRQKIIRLFLWNPKRHFNVAEIAAAVQTKPETARQELLKLQEIDLVSMKKKGEFEYLFPRFRQLFFERNHRDHEELLWHRGRHQAGPRGN